MEINATVPKYYPGPRNIEYQEVTVKTTIRVSNDQQTEATYTYDKNGRLIDTVIYKRDIAII